MQQQSTGGIRTAPAEPGDHRGRLLEGMLGALAEKGYGDATIADIVRHARVSRRTFYEHFTDKRACFLAAYSALSAEVLARILAAATPSLPAEALLDAATTAYVEALEERPDITRSFLVDVQMAGPEALALRRTIHGQFADLIRALADQARETRPDIRPLSREMALAMVAAINELVLLSIEENGAGRLFGVAATAQELLHAVLLGRPPVE